MLEGFLINKNWTKLRRVDPFHAMTLAQGEGCMAHQVFLTADAIIH